MGSDQQAQVGTAVVESEASTEAKDNWKDRQERDQTVAQMKGNEEDYTRKAQERHTGLSLHQIVVPTDRTHKLWEKYHNASGHMGIAKIEGLLRKAFYWPRMGADLQEWASKCPTCTQQKRGPEVRAPLVPILTSYPLETVSIDYLSLGRHGDTYPYLLVITDLFSKYGWAVPTKDKTAATTTRALWRHLIQPWGCPERILSDQGAAFESTMMAQPCRLYGCTKIRTTPYRPQGNGACERFNKTTSVAENKGSWYLTGSPNFVFIDQLRPGLPVFQIKPEGKEGPIKTINRNHLRPCFFNPPEEPQQAPETETVNPNISNALYPGPLLLPLTFVPIAYDPSAVSVDDDPVAPIVRLEPGDVSPLPSGAVSLPVLSLAGIDEATRGVVLQCESKGWYPEPEVLWLDGEGNLLSAGPTETVRGPDDLYTVSSRVTVEKRPSNSFTCRVQQKNTNQTRETEIHVTGKYDLIDDSYGPV
ncbi:hypothetical protein EPR50_G00193660 [Perca flavescens]|uniref:Gypsy retrotransposon integrase-like protein 1 n=1 Tax=Perca flavescens TaxID=8167 RepID=A0A484CE53_PERFV|nr:hypothetical protein EPR50_G00193660 [Perca flavescens]